jgi:hypothetical protein
MLWRENAVQRAMRYDFLFHGGPDIFSVVESRRREVNNKIESILQNVLLNTSEEDLISALVEELSLDVPVLSEEHSADTSETQIDVSNDPMRFIHDRSRPSYIPGNTLTITIPFSGDPRFFKITPTSYTLNPPRGQIKNGELQLEYTQANADPTAIKQQYEQDLRQIKTYLQSLAASADQFNSSLSALVRAALQARKSRLLAAAGVVAALGLPLKRRSNVPETYSVPIRKRKPTIENISLSNRLFQPEPVLAAEEYDQILHIISGMVKVMERSPQAFIGMGEEDLRTHFLVQLNGQYEGQATGETFNSSGKTDILIRANDKNVFIAECKFWKGSKEFLKAIDQLLSYLTWRDTKAALLIFSRNANLSDVLKTVQEDVKSHPHYKRAELPQGETTFRYVFGQPSDHNREIITTIMVFDVPRLS